MDMNQVGRVIVIKHKGRPYEHYGILDGKGNIIHVHKRLGLITRDPLVKALRNIKKVSYLEDDLDTRWNTYRQAEALVGSTHTYKLFTHNCEAFTSKVRTGEIATRQVDQISTTLAIGALLFSAFL